MKRSYIKSRSSNPVSRLEHKADALWQEMICKPGRCIICTSSGVSGHHLLLKSQCRQSRYVYRYHPLNGVPLCVACHVPFAHGKRDEFMEWLRVNRTEQFEWYESILETPEHHFGLSRRHTLELVLLAM